MAGLLIADCSNNNGVVHFPDLHAAGVGAVWLKATEGVTVNDRDFKLFRDEARKAKMRVGAYHFAHPELHDPWVEAKHFASVIGKPGRRDLRPVLDFEVRYSSPSTNQYRWAHEFGQALKTRLGVFPIFYSYQSLIKGFNWSHPVNDGLWLALYNGEKIAEPFEIPSPWKKVVAHQFTQNWECKGHGPYDLSYAPSLKGVLAHPVIGR